MIIFNVEKMKNEKNFVIQRTKVLRRVRNWWQI